MYRVSWQESLRCDCSRSQTLLRNGIDCSVSHHSTSLQPAPLGLHMHEFVCKGGVLCGSNKAKGLCKQRSSVLLECNPKVDSLAPWHITPQERWLQDKALSTRIGRAVGEQRAREVSDSPDDSHQYDRRKLGGIRSEGIESSPRTVERLSKGQQRKDSAPHSQSKHGQKFSSATGWEWLARTDDEGGASPEWSSSHRRLPAKCLAKNIRERTLGSADWGKGQSNSGSNEMVPLADWPDTSTDDTDHLQHVDNPDIACAHDLLPSDGSEGLVTVGSEQHPMAASMPKEVARRAQCSRPQSATLVEAEPSGARPRHQVLRERSVSPGSQPDVCCIQHRTLDAYEEHSQPSNHCCSREDYAATSVPAACDHAASNAACVPGHCNSASNYLAEQLESYTAQSTHRTGTFACTREDLQDVLHQHQAPCKCLGGSCSSSGACRIGSRKNTSSAVRHGFKAQISCAWPPQGHGQPARTNTSQNETTLDVLWDKPAKGLPRMESDACSISSQTRQGCISCSMPGNANTPHSPSQHRQQCMKSIPCKNSEASANASQDRKHCSKRWPAHKCPTVASSSPQPQQHLPQPSPRPSRYLRSSLSSGSSANRAHVSSFTTPKARPARRLPLAEDLSSQANDGPRMRAHQRFQAARRGLPKRPRQQQQLSPHCKITRGNTGHVAAGGDAGKAFLTRGGKAPGYRAAGVDKVKASIRTSQTMALELSVPRSYNTPMSLLRSHSNGPKNGCGLSDSSRCDIRMSPEIQTFLRKHSQTSSPSELDDRHMPEPTSSLECTALPKLLSCSHSGSTGLHMEMSSGVRGGSSQDSSSASIPGIGLCEPSTPLSRLLPKAGVATSANGCPAAASTACCGPSSLEGSACSIACIGLREPSSSMLQPFPEARAAAGLGNGPFKGPFIAQHSSSDKSCSTMSAHTVLVTCQGRSMDASENGNCWPDSASEASEHGPGGGSINGPRVLGSAQRRYERFPGNAQGADVSQDLADVLSCVFRERENIEEDDGCRHVSARRSLLGNRCHSSGDASLQNAFIMSKQVGPDQTCKSFASKSSEKIAAFRPSISNASCVPSTIATCTAPQGYDSPEKSMEANAARSAIADIFSIAVYSALCEACPDHAAVASLSERTPGRLGLHQLMAEQCPPATAVPLLDTRQNQLVSEQNQHSKRVGPTAQKPLGVPGTTACYKDSMHSKRVRPTTQRPALVPETTSCQNVCMDSSHSVTRLRACALSNKTSNDGDEQSQRDTSLRWGLPSVVQQHLTTTTEQAAASHLAYLARQQPTSAQEQQCESASSSVFDMHERSISPHTPLQDLAVRYQRAGTAMARLPPGRSRQRSEHGELLAMDSARALQHEMHTHGMRQSCQNVLAVDQPIRINGNHPLCAASRACDLLERVARRGSNHGDLCQGDSMLAAENGADEGNTRHCCRERTPFDAKPSMHMEVAKGCGHEEVYVADSGPRKAKIGRGGSNSAPLHRTQLFHGKPRMIDGGAEGCLQTVRGCSEHDSM
jgi:hypothetical protein